MAAWTDSETPTTEASDIERVIDLLGGAAVIRHRVRHSLDVHEVVNHCLPGAAVAHLIGSVSLLRKSASCELALGMSQRTFQRYKIAPEKSLNKEQSGRAWTFAEILAKATRVLGSQEEAEQWLERPAIGLDQRRPIDLLGTPTGVKLVEAFLERLEYGVYA